MKDFKEISLNEQEFSDNVAKHRNRFFSYFLSITKNESLANDLVQEVFLTAHRQYMLGLYIENGKLQNYLMKIAGSLLRDYFKEIKRHENGLNDYQTDVSINFGWDEPVCDYLTQTITEADIEAKDKLADDILHNKFNNCAVLSFTEQRILYLRHVSNLSFVKISETLNSPVTTVAFKYKIAVRKIREAVSAWKVR